MSAGPQLSGIIWRQRAARRGALTVANLQIHPATRNDAAPSRQSGDYVAVTFDVSSGLRGRSPPVRGSGASVSRAYLLSNKEARSLIINTGSAG